MIAILTLQKMNPLNTSFIKVATGSVSRLSDSITPNSKVIKQTPWKPDVTNSYKKTNNITDFLRKLFRIFKLSSWFKFRKISRV